jgi:parvulin-like peptidyl-prolyl isomerase
MSSPNTVLLLAAFLACGCARHREDASDPVILSLDEQVVRRSDFERHVQQLETRGGAPLPKDVRRALLDPFLEEQVLILEARANGLLPAQASSEQQQQAVSQLIAQGTAGGSEVSLDEITDYYRAHAEEFREPDRVTLRQIVMASENEARDVRRRVERDPKEFDIIARSRSRSPEAAQGGLMGTFARGELPTELEHAAFALETGGLSDVVTSPLGFHVLRVEAHEPARDIPLEECASRIRTLLLRQKSDQLVRQFVRGLMARAKVNHEAAIPPSSHS